MPGSALRSTTPVHESECDRPPRIVAMGGGTGLPNVLRGLRPIVFPDAAPDTSRDRLVAVVTTSDDGGSSGRLRAELNIIPPGDIRNCLAALCDAHSQLAEIFQYRFGSGVGLNGHAIGNLVLAALADVTSDFAEAVEVAARLVGASGVVLPASSEILTLVAEFSDGRILSGETAISAAGGTIARLSLLPDRPRCSPRVIDAIRRADVVVVGPGSLYTSILPPLLVPEVSEAIRWSPGIRLFVANLMTEPGETDDLSVLEHLLTIERHLGWQPFDCVIYNTSLIPPAVAAAYAARGARAIMPTGFELNVLDRMTVRAIGLPLVSEEPAGKIRHHPERLAAAITAVAQGKLGAWRRASERVPKASHGGL